VQNFARQRPAVFLLGCAAAGFVTGRLLRGGAASSGGSNANGGTTATDPSYTQASRAPSPYPPAPAD
jgi:hypothetical protein